MKALLFREYGGPEMLELADVPDPEIGPADVLVDIQAASLNPIDWKMRAGLLRGAFDIYLPRIPGRDFSGTVAAVGAEVPGIEPGQAVFGAGNPLRNGSHAERIAVEAGLIAPKPDSLNHAEAASLVISGLTALAALEETAPVASGQTVLIHAGAGGVGSLAIQYARSRGAKVLTTASAPNHDFVRRLGAEAAIDYREQPFEKAARDCDIVFDTVGGETHVRSQTCLKPGGTLVYVNAAPIPEGQSRDDITIVNAPVRASREKLQRLSALVGDGAIRPVVEGRFSLDEAADAYARLETGHARGKLVFDIG